ncbi:hypothetical protein OBK20_03870 [Empedobacter falsenii]|uniref:hypothetical protein n=1 Tax=Empedobacter stercoris TaxID=1628248 RepID=UPI001CE1FB05|nr:hypothetical protein [Empedobacter stercoris]MCA4780698.1 hypothetical protein [Empedobacter stercoris]
MNTEELKLNVINQINQLNDFRIIEEIQQLINFESSTEEYQLNETEINRVEDTQKEYKKANILSEDLANQEIDQWLNEK